MNTNLILDFKIELDCEPTATMMDAVVAAAAREIQKKLNGIRLQRGDSLKFEGTYLFRPVCFGSSGTYGDLAKNADS